MARCPLHAVVLVVSLSVATACDAAGPEWFEGKYRLERLEGAPLPATIVRSGSASLTLVEQQLTLGNDGEGTMTASFREVSSRAPQGTLVSSSRPLAYEVSGTTIDIFFPCVDSDCVDASPVSGEITVHGLTVAPPQSSKPASIYVRID